MKVLIVYVNRYRMLAPAPLGASLVADQLRRDGHEVRLLDLMWAPSATRAAAEATRQFAPDLVGFSLRNRDNQSASAYYDALPLARAVVAAVRAAAPGAVTLLGGTAFTTFPSQYLTELDADYGYAGDALEPISRFVASLAAESPDREVPGLVYRDGISAGDSVRENPFAIVGYAGTAFTGWDLVDYRPYRRALNSFNDAAVLTRTGCPFGCVYCDTFRTFGSQWVLRDPRQIAEEVVALRRLHEVRSVYLADAGFNRPLDHAKAVLEALIAARTGVSLEAIFEPGEVDDEFAALFRRAGGRSMMLFAGSLVDEVLVAQRKPFLTRDVFAGAEVLARHGVAIYLMLTLGGPGETVRTVSESTRQAVRLKPMYTLADRGLRLQPGTPLVDLAVAEGLVPSGFDCFRTVFYHSPQTPPAYLDDSIADLQRSQGWGGMASLPWALSYARDKAAAWLR